MPTRDYLGERLKGSLSQARHYEEVLYRLRIFAAEQRFRCLWKDCSPARRGGHKAARTSSA
ncbi:hypothetical protein ACC853_38390, partial [Rhizobium johnstonii]